MVPCIEFSPQILSTAIFTLVILLIVARRVEESLAGLLGIALILILGLTDLYTAFSSYVDWNIISILLGMWIISYLLNDSGATKYITYKLISRTRNVFGVLFLLNLLAGIVTMFVDNVLVVLLFVPIMISVSKLFNIDVVKSSIVIALSANFMGSALLLGDLPPQLLHVIFGAEFMDFIWMSNRPSAFPILLVSFILTIVITLRILFKHRGAGAERDLANVFFEDLRNLDKRYMILSITALIIVIILMALRKPLSSIAGYEIRLGVFPLLVASITSLIAVYMRKTSFERVVEEGIDLNAILFYISLFILVGSLESTGVLDILAESVTPYLINLATAYIIIYWLSAPIVAFVEHDAYILIMLKTFKHLTDSGVLRDPWPLNWALLFSGTLGSNYTAAGAPALYVAFRLIEKDIKRRISPREIYSTTIPYATISLVICFLVSYFIWVR